MRGFFCAGPEVTEASSALIPNNAAWNPDVAALVLLSVRRLELEAGRADPLGPEQLELIQSRPRDTFMPIAVEHRCISLLSWASADFPSADWCKVIRQRADRQRLRRMKSSTAGHRVIATAAAVGARPLWIKGMPLAALTTGRYWSRGRGDIDILVDRARFAASVAALRKAGATLHSSYSPATSPNSRPRHYHAVNLIMQGTAIDLHSRLDLNPRLLDVDHDLLFARRTQVEVGGAMVDTLGLIDATLLHCAHAGRDAWSDFRAISDMTRLLRMVESEGKLNQLQTEADAHSVSTRLGLGVLMARPFSGGWDTIESQIRISPVARFLARIAWRRLARGEQPRWTTGTPDLLRTYLFQVASVSSTTALRWELRKVVIGDHSQRSLVNEGLHRAKSRGTR